MNYEQRLKTAAHFIISNDRSHIEEDPPLNSKTLGISAALKPHQIEGVSWLLRRYKLGVNVVLDGPWKDSASYLFLELFEGPPDITWPFLVLRYVGDKGIRQSLRRDAYDYVKQQLSLSNEQNALPFNVLLTTYDMALLDQDFLCQIPWHYAVIDEAQRLKNPSSVLYNVLEQRFVMPRRLLMTGTPIQNNLSELWALMHFCMPSVFGTLEQFISTFKEAGISAAGQNSAEVQKQFRILKGILRAFMLRRTKSVLVARGILMLPPLTEITMMAPLSPLQKKVYMSILRRELPALLALSSGASSHQSLQNIVMQLRKACSHPYLFNGIEPEPYEEGEHLVQASGKLLVLDQLLKKLNVAGCRVLLFAQMTHTLDILQDFLELRKYTYERLDGSIRAEERFAAIRSFSQQSVEGISKTQPNQHGAFVFMISTRAGGVGLNLVAADTVIFYEQDWNPQVDKQALQRAHRIGQMNHVLSINLVSAHTVEEVIMRRAERKLQLSRNVVGGEDEDHGERKESGPECGDLRSLIFGLHMFDPTEINESSGGVNIAELNAMAGKVLGMRNHKPLDKHNEDEQKFEISPMDLLDEDDISVKRSAASISFDPGFDQASYLSWIEKFKEASQSIDISIMELQRKRNISEARQQKHEADRKKAEEKKLAKWEALGYHSLAVKVPICDMDNDMMSDSGSVQFVYGDCTKPSKVCPGEPTIIFSCIDNSGSWGRGGMFDALANLSRSIPGSYQQAFECGDLHMGDLHLIKINEVNDEKDMNKDMHQWVALAIVQSYKPHRKVPRSSISMLDLEQCMLKASFSAAQNSASIHMPRIGYQDGSDRSEWYTVERLLRKYASIYGIKIFVYYFQRPSQGQARQVDMQDEVSS